jgi:hypothetical protein
MSSIRPGLVDGRLDRDARGGIVTLRHSSPRGRDYDAAMTLVAVVVFTVVAILATCFQFALALGAPFGEMAMGGRYPGKFPVQMRVAAIVQGLIIGALAAIVLTRAGVVVTPLNAPWLIWVVVAFSAVSLFVNAISRSRKERLLWVPAATVMLISSLIVALGAST